MSPIDHTHNPAARSWLASAQAAGCDFPIQNLPFGVFRRVGSGAAFQGGVALGDQVIALGALAGSGLLQGLALQAAQAASGPVLNPLLLLGRPAWQALRLALFALFSEGGAAQPLAAQLLVPQAAVEHAVPLAIGDYTDFYTSIHHALNIGRLFGMPDVTPNFRWLPIAYHGRVSSIGVSGQQVRRPMGQVKPPDAPTPLYRACAWLDFELELGLVVGIGNALGTAVPVAQAEDHLFGICLLNDWSARDIQGWEMAPLGPFQAKNFATTVSPWIVTLEALAPYRCPLARQPGDPACLPYLDDEVVRRTGGFDIQMSVWLQTAAQHAAQDARMHPTALTAPVRICATSFKHQYWTPAQMLAQHTVGGCNLQAGDLMGSGTVSGPTAGEAGAMMELTQAGRVPLQLPGANGTTEERGFLADGDRVVLRGHCQASGFAHIGFGECSGTVLPAQALRP